MSTSSTWRIGRVSRCLAVGLVAVLAVASSAPPPIAAADPTPTGQAAATQAGDPGPGGEPAGPPATVPQAATPPSLLSPGHATFQTGDLFMSVGNTPIVQWRLPDGTLNQTLNLGYPAPGTVAAGMAFGPDGTLYATNFNSAQIYEFTVTGASGAILGGQCCSGDYNLPESIASDRAGHLIVGQAGGNPGSITAPVIHKIDLAGNVLGQWTVATDTRGADWVDVEPDGCTVLYTSEGRSVKRFNICTGTQLADFATNLPGANAFALRILPDGSVLVADTASVVHLSSAGQILGSYTRPGETYFFSLALDSDGTSFWAGSLSSGNVYKMAIATGALEQSFYAGGVVNGLAVYNAGAIFPQGVPLNQTLGGGTAGANPNGTRDTNETREPVNTLTGNYTNTVTDFTLPGRGLNVAFTRTYNSQGAGTAALGPGWTDAYAVGLVLNGDGTITFTDENGAQYVYRPNGSGGWLTPAGGRSSLTSIGGGYQLLRHDQVRYAFDSTGLLQRETDRNGNALTFAYTAGLLTQVSDPVGRIVTLGYGANNRLATVAGPPSRQVSYGYNGAGQLASVTDLRGGLTRYTYDAAGHLATITDQNNHVVVTNVYDAAGRVQTQTDAANHTATFGWDPSTGTSTMTDARGGVWTDAYVNGVLARQSDPLGDTTTFGYDPALDALVTTDPRGNSTSATYDASGNLLTRGGAGELSLDTYTYDGLNDVVSHTDGRHNTTTYQYDAAGNLTTMTEPGGATVIYGRDPAGTGLLVSLTDERGKTTTYGHDAQANLTSITTPLGELTTMTYDAAGAG